jgi:hypothetical protein
VNPAALDELRRFFPEIAIAIRLLGAAIAVFGLVRVARAPAFAARRRPHPALGRAFPEQEPISLGALLAAGNAADAAPEREPSVQGLIDFYRISGALIALAGIVLVLLSILAA